MAVTETGNDTGYPTGVYTHRETGEEILCVASSKFGNPQAAAATRVGFELTKALSGKELKERLEVPFVDPHAPPAATPRGELSVAEAEAQLAEAKAREQGAKDRLEATKEVNELADLQSGERANAAEGTQTTGAQTAAKESAKKGSK